MWEGSSGFCVISCCSSRKASFTSELKMHWCSFLSWEDIVKGFESARHLLSASPVIPLRWNQVMEVLLCPRSLDSSHQVSGLKFWLDKLDLGATLWFALSHPYFCILEKSFQRDFSQHQVAGGEMPQVAKRSQGVSAHLCWFEKVLLGRWSDSAFYPSPSCPQWLWWPVFEHV